MDSEELHFKAQVQLFPQKGGWHYVGVPSGLSKPFEDLADRGLIAITATIGGTSWDTSMLPMGDGSHFIALPAKVRTAENINVDDKISTTFKLRAR